MNDILNKYIDKPYEIGSNEDDLHFVLSRSFDSDDKSEVVKFMSYWITIETICSFVYERTKNNSKSRYNFYSFIKNNQEFINQITNEINRDVGEFLKNMNVLLEKPIAPFANYEFLDDKQEYYNSILLDANTNDSLTFDGWFNYLFKNYDGNEKDKKRARDSLYCSLDSFKAIYNVSIKYKKDKNSKVKKSEAIKICDSIRIIRNNLFHCNKGSYYSLANLKEDSRDYRLIKAANWFMRTILCWALSRIL